MQPSYYSFSLASRRIASQEEEKVTKVLPSHFYVLCAKHVLSIYTYIYIYM